MDQIVAQVGAEVHSLQLDALDESLRNPGSGNGGGTDAKISVFEQLI